MRLSLSDFQETAIADGVYRACAVSSDVVYYISAQDGTALMRADVQTATTQQVATAAANMTDLHLMPEGLVAELADGLGTLLYNERADGFAEYTGEISADTLYTGGFLPAPERRGPAHPAGPDPRRGRVCGLWRGDFAVLDGKVYYISSAVGQTGLKAFDPAQMSWQMLASLDESVTQIAASAESLFVLDELMGEVSRVDIEQGTLTAFERLDVSGLAEDGYTRTGLRMEALSGLVVLYGVYTPADLEAGATSQTSEVPSFSFGEVAQTAGEAQDIAHTRGRLERRGRGDHRGRAQAPGGVRHALARQPRRRGAQAPDAPDRARLLKRRCGRHLRLPHAVRGAPFADRPCDAALPSTAWPRPSFRTCSLTRTFPHTTPISRSRAAIPACA